MTIQEILKEFEDLEKGPFFDMLEQRGLDRGKAIGARSTLIRLGERKFGEVPNDAREKIEETQDLEQLQLWTEKLIDSNCQSWNDLWGAAS